LEGINYGYQQLLEVVIQSDNGWFYTSSGVTLPSGSNTISLSGMNKVVGLDYQVSPPANTTWVDVPIVSFLNRNITSPNPYSLCPFMYRVFGGNINIVPTPTTSTTWNIWYIPDAPPLNLSTSIQLEPEWAEYVINKAAIRLLGDEVSMEEVGNLTAECAVLEEKIKRHAVVDDSYPEQMTDMATTRGFTIGGPWSDLFGPGGGGSFGGFPG
jgi:hypothetical protein